MHRSKRIIFAGTIGLLVAAQSVPADADRLFEERQYEAALAIYDRLALTTLDPGLIAFNRGVTLLKLNRFSEAERAFRQSLDDAAIPKSRQARGLYNLGICLIQQADDKDLVRLKAALECFERAGDEADDAELKSDAEFNRSVAEALYAEAKRKAPPPPEPEANAPNPKPEPPDNANPSTQPSDPNQPKPGGEGDRTGGKAGAGEPQPSDKKPLPGAGSLPVLIDAEEPQKLSPAETRELLEKADARLRGERRRVREGAAAGGDKPRPNNW